MSQIEVFSDGNDVDFDKINDEKMIKLATTEKVKADIVLLIF